MVLRTATRCDCPRDAPGTCSCTRRMLAIICRAAGSSISAASAGIHGGSCSTCCCCAAARHARLRRSCCTGRSANAAAAPPPLPPRRRCTAVIAAAGAGRPASCSARGAQHRAAGRWEASSAIGPGVGGPLALQALLSAGAGVLPGRAESVQLVQGAPCEPHLPRMAGGSLPAATLPHRTLSFCRSPSSFCIAARTCTSKRHLPSQPVHDACPLPGRLQPAGAALLPW